MTTMLCTHTEMTVRRPARTGEASRGDMPRTGKRRPSGRVPGLDADEERAGRPDPAGDRQARDTLITANLGLIVHIVRDFRCAGMTTEDLRQEGTCGLIPAAELYDPDRHEARFASYAASWIRRYVQRAAAENFSLIRLPSYLIWLQGRFQRALAESRLDASSESDRPFEGDSGPTLCGEDEGAGRGGLDRLAGRLRMSDRRLRSVVSSLRDADGVVDRGGGRLGLAGGVGDRPAASRSGDGEGRGGRRASSGDPIPDAARGSRHQLPVWTRWSNQPLGPSWPGRQRWRRDAAAHEVQRRKPCPRHQRGPGAQGPSPGPRQASRMLGRHARRG